VGLASATLLALPAAASASASKTSTRPAVHPTPALYLSGEFSVQHKPVTIPGRGVELTGVVRPYVRGQKVELRAFVGGHQVAHVRLRLKASRHHAYGGFKWLLRSPGVGNVSVVVDHTATRQMAGFERRQGEMKARLEKVTLEQESLDLARVEHAARAEELRAELNLDSR